MGAKKLYILMFLGFLAACAQENAEEGDFPGRTKAAYRNVVFLTENSMRQTISVFRQGDSGFVFMETIPVTEARTETQLPEGNYQFLFAGSYGKDTEMNAAVPGITLFPSMRFTVLADEADPDYMRNGDELFLQDGKADSVYVIQGTTTVRATLKRAVARVIVNVRRGIATGNGEYVPLPYQNDSIVRYFNTIRLEIENAGKAVDARGIAEGKGKLSVTVPASSKDSLTPEGFAVYEGPFFFPASNRQPVDIKLTLYRAENSPQPDLSLSCRAAVKRNEQLILNAWVTDDWNFIGVTADTEAISRETEGEQDVWDDNITY